MEKSELLKELRNREKKVFSFVKQVLDKKLTGDNEYFRCLCSYIRELRFVIYILEKGCLPYDQDVETSLIYLSYQFDVDNPFLED